MARRSKAQDAELQDDPQDEQEDEGEQLMLLDVDSAFTKPIKAAARKYKKALSARQSALTEEIDAKKKIISLVKEAMASESTIKADADGVIAFQVEGMAIRIVPRDEVVRIKMDEDEAGEE